MLLQWTQLKKKNKGGQRGEGHTNVSAPWLETLFTKDFKICLKKNKKGKTWESTGESLGGWLAVHLTPRQCCCLVPSRKACA